MLPPVSHYVPEHDPANDAYDPHRFSLSVESSATVWRAEPRVEPWASEREAVLEAWLQEHLVKVAPDAELVDVSCKQQTCRLAIEAPLDQLDELTDRYPIVMLAPATGIESGPAGVSFYLKYPRSLVDADAYREYLERQIANHAR